MFECLKAFETQFASLALKKNHCPLSHQGKVPRVGHQFACETVVLTQGHHHTTERKAPGGRPGCQAPTWKVGTASSPSPWTPAMDTSFPLSLLKWCPKSVAHAGDEGLQKAGQGHLPNGPVSRSLFKVVSPPPPPPPQGLEGAEALLLGPRQPTQGSFA